MRSKYGSEAQSTASTTNQARWSSGNQSRRLAGRKYCCSRSHGGYRSDTAPAPYLTSSPGLPSLSPTGLRDGLRESLC